eukprot:403375181
MNHSGKLDRKNSKSNDSLKQRSSSKKMQSSKKLSSSLNSLKMRQSKGTVENNSQRKKKTTQKMNLSFQSLANIGDITANFQSLQNSTRLQQNNLGQLIQPFNTNQGHRANSQGHIINIQTPSSGSQTMISHQNSNLLQLPQNRYQFLGVGQGSTDRSSNSYQTEQTYHAPLTATLINPSISSNPQNAMNFQQIYNSRPNNFSNSQRNSYSPAAKAGLSRQNDILINDYNYQLYQSSNHNSNKINQTYSVSPVKIIQANPLSFQNTIIPPGLVQNYGSFLLQKLELFWKERILKLNETISQVRDQAIDSDDIIRTMLENQETQDFANQRIIELIKEGVGIEQELQIESLSKQIIIHQSESINFAQQRDNIAQDYKKLYDEHQNFRNDMEIIVNELKKKKNKYKSKMSSIEDYKNELKQVKEERDNLLEKLKHYKNDNDDKINFTEQKIDELQRVLQEQDNQREQLVQTINQLREDSMQREHVHSQLLDDFKLTTTEQLAQQKKKYKMKLEQQLQAQKDQLEQQFKQKHLELMQVSEFKQQSKSQVEQQTLDYLQNEIANLKQQLEESLSINEHETILNSQLLQMRTTHEREIDVIKEAFERELRKAEKSVRSSVKKEESKLRQSVCDFELNIEKLKNDKEQFEKQTRDEIADKNAQINKLKELIGERDQQYVKDVQKYKDKIMNYELQLQQQDLSRKEEIESIKIEHTKSNLSQTFQLQQAETQLKQLQKDVNDAADQILRKDNLLKEKELLINKIQSQFLLLETEFNDYQKKQLEKSKVITVKSDEINDLNKQIVALKMKNLDFKNQMKWKLEREQERVKRVNQEIQLIKKILQQEMDFAFKDNQNSMNMLLQQVSKKIESVAKNEKLMKNYSHQLEIEKINNEHKKLISQLKDLELKNNLMVVENEQLKSKQEKIVNEFSNQQKNLEEHYIDEMNKLNKLLNEEKDQHVNNYQQLNMFNEEVEQLKTENSCLHQKISDLDTILQELDYKLKNCESERDLFKQQLAFEEKSKTEESQHLRTQFQTKQDQLIADFKDQCLKLRSEIEESYHTKLKNKVNQLKNKQEEEINDIISKFEQRDQEYNEKITCQRDEYEQALTQMQEELIKAKKDYKKLVLKYKQVLKKDQENVTKIEEEVFKSLAKVNSSVQSVGRRQTNLSFMTNTKSSSRMIDRSFQNITNQSMFVNNPSRDQADLVGKINLTLQSNKNYHNQSFNSLQVQGVNNRNQSTYLNQSPYSRYQEYSKSTRNPPSQENVYQFNQQNPKNHLVLGDTQSTHQSLLIQELNTLQNNNQNNMSMNLRKISPISKSLNQTDISGGDTSSFIMVNQSQSAWPPSRALNQNQYLSMHDSHQQQQLQLQINNNSSIPPLRAGQNTSHLKQQHSSLMQHVQSTQNNKQTYILGMSSTEKQKLREQIDRDKQMSQRSDRKNRFDMVLGGGLQASFMDGSAYKNQESYDVTRNQQCSNEKSHLGNGGLLLDSGTGNNESFLIARSLSPKEKTGKFGSFNKKAQVN